MLKEVCFSWFASMFCRYRGNVRSEARQRRGNFSLIWRFSANMGILQFFGSFVKGKNSNFANFYIGQICQIRL
jgi:hypothetical protein